MSGVVTLPDRFVEEIWDSRSAVIPRAELAVDFPDDDVIFDAMKAIGRKAGAAGEPGRKDSVANMVSALDNRPSTPQPEPRLVPLEADRRLDDYLDRCARFAAGRPWATAFFGLHKVSPALWDFAKDFADAVAAATGRRPAGRVDFDCFVGRYDKTHVGAHIDDAHSFGFNLRAGKQLLTWPEEFDATMRTPTLRYEPHRAQSKVLTCSPDVVTYFPSREIHVAESSAGISVNSNIALFENVNHLDRMWHETRRAIHHALDEAGTGGASGDLTPDGVAGWLDALAAAGTSESLEVTLLSAALCWSTSSQLGCARPKAAEPPAGDELPPGRKRRTLTAQSTKSGEQLVVSGNGWAASLRADDSVREFVDGFDRAAIGASVLDLLAGTVQRSPAAASLYRRLWAWGVVTP